MMRERRMCQACIEGHHWNCGMQTWCECECDPENPDSYTPDMSDFDEEVVNGQG